MKRKGFFIVIATLLMVLMAWIFDSENYPGQSQLKEKVFIIAAVDTPGGFDGDALKPGTQNTVVQVNEPLLKFAVKTNPDGTKMVDPNKIEGRLAERWEVSPDGKTYTFNLRKGVKSFYGNELTADDVKWSWEKSLTQKRSGYFNANMSSLEKVEVVDRYAVKFTLKEPNQIFLKLLTHYCPGIYDSTEMKKHATEKDPFAIEWLNSNTCGYGPYQLESVTPGEGAVFIANPNYYKGAAKISKVLYKTVPSAANRMALLQSGEVDMAENLTFQQLAELKKKPGVKVVSVKGNYHNQIRINFKFPPWDNKKVRQAFAYAVPYNDILKTVYFGFATPMRGVIVDIMPGFAGDKLWKYTTNIEKAKGLLKEAGFPKGVKAQLYYTTQVPAEEQIAILVKSSAAKAGLDLELIKITPSEFWARTAISKRDLPTHVTFEQSNILDPGWNLFVIFHKNGVANRADYANPEVDKLIDTGFVEQDLKKRMEIYRKIQEITIDELPWIPLAQTGQHEAIRKNIEGLVWYPDNHERWYDLDKK